MENSVERYMTVKELEFSTYFQFGCQKGCAISPASYTPSGELPGF